jgi:hypothetical protein
MLNRRGEYPIGEVKPYIKGNCYDFVTSSLGLDRMFAPNDKILAEYFEIGVDVKEANVVGVRTNYRDGTGDYTHMGLVKNLGSKIVIDHVPNVGQDREPNVELDEFVERYSQDGGQIVFLKLKN